jgi:hypothetical protein
MRSPDDSWMNDLTHEVADRLEECLGEGVVDRNALNQRLEEYLLRPFYDLPTDD